MKRSIVQTGSSLAVTLPMEVVQAFGLQKGPGGRRRGPSPDRRHHDPAGRRLRRGRPDHGPVQGAGRRGPRSSNGAAQADAAMTRYLSAAAGFEPSPGPDGSAQRRSRHPRSAGARRGHRQTHARVRRRGPLPVAGVKAAALLHAIVTTTPFVTASKGTAAVAAECFLAANGFALAATDQELAEMTTSVEKGELGIEAASIWVRQRVRKA